jgi:hypothetical protein
MNSSFRIGLVLLATLFLCLHAQVGLTQQSKTANPGAKAASSTEQAAEEKPSSTKAISQRETKKSNLNVDKPAVNSATDGAAKDETKAGNGDQGPDRQALGTAGSAQPAGPEKPAKPTKSTVGSRRSKNFAITFNDLKFEMEKTEKFSRTMLTEKINGYHGGKVKIRGYIRPNFKQTGITKFIFVRDNKECCFGPQAAIFDNILVRLGKDQSVNYTVRPVTVEGNFVLKEYNGPDGNVWSLYRMYDAKVVR